MLKTIKDGLSTEKACRKVKSVFEDNDKKTALLWRDQVLDAVDFKVIGELMIVGTSDNFTVGVDHPNIWPVWNAFTAFFELNVLRFLDDSKKDIATTSLNQNT